MKTCSKESGARLVELGVTKESYFKRLKSGFDDELYPPHKHYKLFLDGEDSSTPAYTACELGEMLPKHITLFKTGNDWEIIYGDYKPVMGGKTSSEYADTMAEAMALMLIWLLENGHITKEQP